jgi:hypothetical protein
MGFFQSFIRDANHGSQELKQAEPVDHAPPAESPPGLMPAETAVTAAAFAAPPYSDAKADAQKPGVRKNAPPDIEPEAAAPAVLSVLREESADIAIQPKQPTIEAAPDQKPVLREFSSMVVNQDERPGPFGSVEKKALLPAGHPTKKKKERKINRDVQEIAKADTGRVKHEANPPSNMPFEAHEHAPDLIPVMNGGIAQRISPASSPEAAADRETAPQERNAATITATPVRQPELLSVAVPEKPSPIREKSEPQVRIGTIEVIVESTPVMQRSLPPDAGFTRDPGRYYQRRL